MRLLMAVAHLNFHLMRATQLADWLWSHLGRVIKSRAHCRSAVIVSSAARVTHFRVAEYYDRPARPLVHLLIEGGHRQSRRPATCAGRLRRAEAYACQRQLITRLLLVHGMAAVEKAVVNHVKPNREFSLLEMRRFFCVCVCVSLLRWVNRCVISPCERHRESADERMGHAISTKKYCVSSTRFLCLTESSWQCAVIAG